MPTDKIARLRELYEARNNGGPNYHQFVCTQSEAYPYLLDIAEAAKEMREADVAHQNPLLSGAALDYAYSRLMAAEAALYNALTAFEEAP